ncbi:MAG: hypothetical protein KC731_24910 [Myxococcales bacterium]|nr:hypothetical protein [Myxococcales bacterium]
MALPLEFSSVILRKDALDRRLPGGVDDFARFELPNWAEDEHLVRVGYMASAESTTLVEALLARGLRDDPEDGDVAVVESFGPPAASWLEIGDVDGTRACWLRGVAPGELVALGRHVSIWLVPSGDGAAAVRRAARHLSASLRGSGEQLQCLRDDALVNVLVVARPHDDTTVVIVSRDIARRAAAADDGLLMSQLELHLATEAGARHS